MRTLALALVAGLAASAAHAQGTTATASFIDADGETIGTATLTETPNGVLIEVDVEGIEAGEHGFHVHETGECDPATGFDSAGGHYAAGMEHGFLVEGGPHPGDMANVFVGEDGTLRHEVVNDRVSIEGGDNPLMDDDGSALMIHSGADDYTTQPDGAAGGRVACAVIGM
ncbi:superoxide dismutase family protein [Acuticoccus sp.]|uniref:superoxide dismutase family protein n=1 Tax=Acuticoccus sp. TaxID=1904378 RepID=UPI003B51A086